MLTMNEKLQKTSKKHGVRVFSFDLPAGETCLNADACKVGCFGKQGWYVKRCVKNHLARNLEISRSLDFKDRMKHAIRWRRAEVVRIHSTGDFYSPLYLDKWLDIVSEVPIHFYTYTKQVSWLRSVKLPLNLTVVYSLGGKEDHLIKLDQDKHSKVFATEQELQKDGYANASGDDFVVFQEDRIGIVYHGLRKYRNTGFAGRIYDRARPARSSLFDWNSDESERLSLSAIEIARGFDGRSHDERSGEYDLLALDSLKSVSCGR